MHRAGAGEIVEGCRCAVHCVGGDRQPGVMMGVLETVVGRALRVMRKSAVDSVKVLWSC